MKLHRFYAPDIKLANNFWLHDEKLLHQWNNVLRFKPGQQVVLFDGLKHDKLYEIDEIKRDEAHLMHVTDFERKIPECNVYLLWSLLKNDKNDWVLQKGTELGVSHFIPLIADRCARTDLAQHRLERWEKIVTEAAEQCGRSDIPTVREPMHVATAIRQLGDKVTFFICEQDGADEPDRSIKDIGILIGPEGGWSDAEKALFEQNNIKHLNLHDFTLRAETAAIVADLCDSSVIDN